MIKKLIIAIILSIFCFGFTIQDMHKAVIARKNVVAGGGDGAVGNTVVTSTEIHYNAGGIAHSKFVIPTDGSAGTVGYAHLRISDGNSNGVCVALYSAAGAVLLQCEDTLSDGTDEWANIACTGTYELEASTTYYLGFHINDGAGNVVYYRGTAVGEYIWDDNNPTASCATSIDTAEEHSVGADFSLSIYFDNQAGSPE